MALVGSSPLSCAARVQPKPHFSHDRQMSSSLEWRSNSRFLGSISNLKTKTIDRSPFDRSLPSIYGYVKCMAGFAQQQQTTQATTRKSKKTKRRLLLLFFSSAARCCVCVLRCRPCFENSNFLEARSDAVARDQPGPDPQEGPQQQGPLITGAKRLS